MASTNQRNVPRSSGSQPQPKKRQMSLAANQGEGVKNQYFPLLPSLACILESLCSTNDALLAQRKAMHMQEQFTLFHGVKPPEISLLTYLQRLCRYAQCSWECFVCSLIFIDRIIKAHPEVIVSSVTIHRLLLTGVMVAAKFYDDAYLSNLCYARIGGVENKEINALEIEFLFLADFELYIAPEVFNQYWCEICEHARTHCAKRLASGSPLRGDLRLALQNQAAYIQSAAVKHMSSPSPSACAAAVQLHIPTPTPPLPSSSTSPHSSLSCLSPSSSASSASSSGSDNESPTSADPNEDTAMPLMAPPPARPLVRLSSNESEPSEHDEDAEDEEEDEEGAEEEEEEGMDDVSENSMQACAREVAAITVPRPQPHQRSRAPLLPAASAASPCCYSSSLCATSAAPSSTSRSYASQAQAAPVPIGPYPMNLNLNLNMSNMSMSLPFTFSLDSKSQPPLQLQPQFQPHASYTQVPVPYCSVGFPIPSASSSSSSASHSVYGCAPLPPVSSAISTSISISPPSSSSSVTYALVPVSSSYPPTIPPAPSSSSSSASFCYPSVRVPTSLPNTFTAERSPTASFASTSPDSPQPFSPFNPDDCNGGRISQPSSTSNSHVNLQLHVVANTNSATSSSTAVSSRPQQQPSSSSSSTPSSVVDLAAQSITPVCAKMQALTCETPVPVCVELDHDNSRPEKRRRVYNNVTVSLPLPVPVRATSLPPSTASSAPIPTPTSNSTHLNMTIPHVSMNPLMMNPMNLSTQPLHFNMNVNAPMFQLTSVPVLSS